jgi:hypothetical protein
MAKTDTEHSTTPRPHSPVWPTGALKLALSQLPDRSIDKIAQNFTNWVRGGDCRLWCNGKLVPPSFSTTSLVMVAREEVHGPHLDVMPAGGVGWDPMAYEFELDADEICALLPAKAKLNKKAKRQPQSDRARWALRRIFPGRNTIPDNVGTGILEHRIVADLQSEAARQAGMDGEPYPSWRVINDLRGQEF